MRDKTPDVTRTEAKAIEFYGHWLVFTIYGIQVVTDEPFDENGEVRNDFPCLDTREKRRYIRIVNPAAVISLEFMGGNTVLFPGGAYKEDEYVEIQGISNGNVRSWRIRKGEKHSSKRTVSWASPVGSNGFDLFLSEMLC
jgi:hypothetical protein